MQNYETISFSKARQFLNSLRPSDDRWLEKGEWECHWIFRGQLDADWYLTPSALRERRAGDRVWSMAEEHTQNRDRVVKALTSMEHLVPKGVDKAERLVCVATQLIYEFLSMRGFAHMVNELGLRVPGPPYDRMTIPDVLDRIRTPDIRPMHDVAALAQHHGIPTRLLDWTAKPFVAAYFAASDAKPSDTNGEKKLCVWALHERNVHHDVRVLRFPRSDFGFLHAQSGLFTYVRDADSHWLSHGKWPTVDQRTTPDVLKKLTLPYSEAAELVRLLWAEGISKAHLMPTLDNVKNALEEAFERMSWLESNVLHENTDL